MDGCHKRGDRKTSEERAKLEIATYLQYGKIAKCVTKNKRNFSMAYIKANKITHEESRERKCDP